MLRAETRVLDDFAAEGEESQGRGRRISSLPTFGRGAAFHRPPGIHHVSASTKGR